MLDYITLVMELHELCCISYENLSPFEHYLHISSYWFSKTVKGFSFIDAASFVKLFDLLFVPFFNTASLSKIWCTSVAFLQHLEWVSLILCDYDT